MQNDASSADRPKRRGADSAERSASDQGRTLPSCDEPRRIAAAYQCIPRRNVARRTSATCSRDASRTTTLSRSRSKLLPPHHVRPGMTGWAQVNNLRGEIASLAAAQERVAYDLHYIEHWSVWMDLKIILLTFRTVLSRK